MLTFGFCRIEIVPVEGDQLTVTCVMRGEMVEEPYEFSIADDIRESELDDWLSRTLALFVMIADLCERAGTSDWAPPEDSLGEGP